MITPEGSWVVAEKNPYWYAVNMATGEVTFPSESQEAAEFRATCLNILAEP